MRGRAIAQELSGADALAPEERNVYSSVQSVENRKVFQAVTGYKHFVPSFRLEKCVADVVNRSCASLKGTHKSNQENIK